ncbi:MAG: tetratricopeptide repeat protein [Candidatus Zixiibacteriota bacterium]
MHRYSLRALSFRRPSLILIALAFVFTSCKTESGKIEDLKARGQKAFLNSQYKEARESFLKALAIKPSDRDLLYFTGLCYKRDYIYDSALLYLKRADILYPGDREINLEVYSVAVATKSWKEAVGAIMVLVSTGDPLEIYLEQLTQMYVRLDEPLNVVYYLRKLVASRPDSALHYLQLANALLVVESLDVAVGVIDSAVARFGPRNELVATRATIAAYQGKYDEAEKVYRTLLLTDSTRTPQYKLNLANVLSLQSEKAKKREALELYKAVRNQVDAVYRIDSLIDTLEKELR